MAKTSKVKARPGTKGQKPSSRPAPAMPKGKGGIGKKGPSFKGGNY